MGSARPRALSLGRHGNRSASTKRFPPNEVASSGSELAPCMHPPQSANIPTGVSVYEPALTRAKGASTTVLSTLLKYVGYTFNFYLLLFHLCREGNCRHLTNGPRGCRVSLGCWWVTDAEMWFHNSVIRLCTFTVSFISASPSPSLVPEAPWEGGRW